MRVIFFLMSVSATVWYISSPQETHTWTFKQAVVSILLKMYLFLSLLNPHFSVSWDCNHLLLDIILLLLNTTYFFICHLPVISLFFLPEKHIKLSS